MTLGLMMHRWNVLLPTLGMLVIGLARGDVPTLPDLVERVSPSVVEIIIQMPDAVISGSGFFVETNVIMTNSHVVRGAPNIEIKLSDGTSCNGSVIAEDPIADLALVRTSTGIKRGQPLIFRDTAPRVGDEVVVIGAPKQLAQTVSNGIVSSIRVEPDYGEVVQITAPTSPGSSGSPVLDRDGAVIGVLTYKVRGGENLNFAVSSKTAKRLKSDAHSANELLPKFELVAHDSNKSVWDALPPNVQRKVKEASRYYFILPDGRLLCAYGFLRRREIAFSGNRPESLEGFGAVQNGPIRTVEVVSVPPQWEGVPEDGSFLFPGAFEHPPSLHVENDVVGANALHATLGDQHVVVLLVGSAPFRSNPSDCVLWRVRDSQNGMATRTVYAAISLEALRPTPTELATILFATTTPVVTYSVQRESHQTMRTEYGPGSPGYRQTWEVPEGPLHVTYRWSRVQTPLKPLDSAGRAELKRNEPRQEVQVPQEIVLNDGRVLGGETIDRSLNYILFEVRVGGVRQQMRFSLDQVVEVRETGKK